MSEDKHDHATRRAVFIGLIALIVTAWSGVIYLMWP